MQPHLSRPPLQSIQRQAGGFSVPNAPATGRSLYVPPRLGQPLPVHNLEAVPHSTNPRYSHYADHKEVVPAYANMTQALFAQPESAQPHPPDYQPHTFVTPAVPHTPHRQFPLGPFIITVIVGVTIFGAWAGYHAFSTPDPVNAAPVVYSK